LGQVHRLPGPDDQDCHGHVREVHHSHDVRRSLQREGSADRHGRGRSQAPCRLAAPAPTSAMADVVLEGVEKNFGDVRAVAGIDLTVKDQEFLILVGPSGCGKTTTLRMIAGLEEVSGGDIRIGGHSVTHLPPRDRDIAMVFQSYALYPHMTVYRNMSFSLRLRGMRKAGIGERAQEAAGILGLPKTLQRKPPKLPG